jgi:hypothetical protein
MIFEALAIPIGGFKHAFRAIGRAAASSQSCNGAHRLWRRYQSDDSCNGCCFHSHSEDANGAASSSPELTQKAYASTWSRYLPFGNDSISSSSAWCQGPRDEEHVAALHLSRERLGARFLRAHQRELRPAASRKVFVELLQFNGDQLNPPTRQHCPVAQILLVFHR